MPKINGIYALCDTSLTPGLSHLSLARQLLAGGIKILQLRMKGAKDKAKVYEVARSLAELKKDYSFTFIINDFVEVAAELPVDGVHLGQDDMGITAARQQLPKDCLIGYSSHSLVEAKKAEQEGADYVALGAIFPTATKGPGHPVQGIGKLKEVVQAVKIPIVAIGGIGRSHFAEVVETGVDAIAMISALTCARNITEEARWFVARALKGQGSVSRG